VLTRLLRYLIVLGFVLSLAAVFASAARKAPIPPPITDVALASSSGKQTAVFAGGCFWGTQSVFERVKGVLKTTAGYAGGSASTATYDQVTTERTEHAESVEFTTLRKSPMANCCVYSFPSPMIRRSLTGRDRTLDLPTVP
jgi:peptide-methionine (S)-S-oxide reductase